MLVVLIKVRVLQKEPRGRDVNDGDRFVFNRDFTAKLHRIKVNSIQLKETTEENEKTHEAVFRDRQYQVRGGMDAFRVRGRGLGESCLVLRVTVWGAALLRAGYV